MSLLLLVAFVICLVAAVTDLKRGAIPNGLTLPVLVCAPFVHVGLALSRGERWREAVIQGLLSLVGVVVCGAVPLFMWKKQAIGGGDVKLFAALGALLLPRFGFETELYVLVAAALLAPAKLAYDGTLLRALGNIGSQLLNVVRPKARRTPLDPEMTSWFRLGPCFLLGLCVQLALHWRAP